MHFCVLILLRFVVQVVPGIWKADIKAAFRRMPICKEHRWAAGIAFKAEGQASIRIPSRDNLAAVCMCCWLQVWVSIHNACPFGALSSVHGWERTGRVLTIIARRLLHLPVHRYVDDLFAADR